MLLPVKAVLPARTLDQRGVSSCRKRFTGAECNARPPVRPGSCIRHTRTVRL